MLAVGCTAEEPIRKVVLKEGETYTMAGTNCSFSLVGVRFYRDSSSSAAKVQIQEGPDFRREEVSLGKEAACGRLKIKVDYIDGGVAGFYLYKLG